MAAVGKPADKEDPLRTAVPPARDTAAGKGHQMPSLQRLDMFDAALLALHGGQGARKTPLPRLDMFGAA